MQDDLFGFGPPQGAVAPAAGGAAPQPGEQPAAQALRADEGRDAHTTAPAEATAEPAATRKRRTGLSQVTAVEPGPHLKPLADALPPLLRLGTSSWTYPGWAGLVWDREYSERQLSRQGLAAYASHPLMRTVCLDRAFWRPLTASQYALYAAQTPPDFRFVVKAPALIADATVRAEDGRGMQPNPAFLDPQLALQECVTPLAEGLGNKLGALVLQLSPLPAAVLGQADMFLDRLGQVLDVLAGLRATAPDAVVAVELRDPVWLSADWAPALVDVLRAHGATYCLGLHAKLPAIEAQLPLLRALWPGPLVCRWNLHRSHGPYGYEDAQQLYAPYDRLVDPDPATRAVLARVARATVAASQAVFVTISNKAEGSAPQSVELLAQELLSQPD